MIGLPALFNFTGRKLNAFNDNSVMSVLIIAFTGTGTLFCILTSTPVNGIFTPLLAENTELPGRLTKEPVNFLLPFVSFSILSLYRQSKQRAYIETCRC